MPQPILDEAGFAWRVGSTPQSREALARIRRLKVTGIGSGFLFGGARPLTRSQDKRWRKAVTAAGVRYRNPEQLRHTCASILLARGAPITEVQAQGGWANATTLFQYYAKAVQ